LFEKAPDHVLVRCEATPSRRVLTPIRQVPGAPPIQNAHFNSIRGPSSPRCPRSDAHTSMRRPLTRPSGLLVSLYSSSSDACSKQELRLAIRISPGFFPHRRAAPFEGAMFFGCPLQCCGPALVPPSQPANVDDPPGHARWARHNPPKLAKIRQNSPGGHRLGRSIYAGCGDGPSRAREHSTWREE
jgi:hypothetical protein